MSDNNAPQRFSESEVSAILKRAVELQSARGEEGQRDNPSSGTSLAQLQQAASELGIDPGLIELAADELGRNSELGSGSSFLGGPWKADLEQVIPGIVNEEDLPALLAEIRRASGRVGHPKMLGNSFEWLSETDHSIHVAVTPQDDKTAVRVRAWFGVWAFTFYGLTSLTAFMLSLALCSQLHLTPLGNTLLVGGLFSVGFLGARTALQRVCAGKMRKTHAVMTSIRQQILHSVETQELPSVTRVASPVVEAAPQIQEITHL